MRTGSPSPRPVWAVPPSPRSGSPIPGTGSAASGPTITGPRPATPGSRFAAPGSRFAASGARPVTSGPRSSGPRVSVARRDRALASTPRSLGTFFGSVRREPIEITF